jgi:polysaccharide biosynthesis/export protein
MRVRGIKKFSLYYTVILTLPLFATSCYNRHATYFKDIPDSITQQVVMPAAEFKEPVIQSNDNLLITVKTLDQLISTSGNGTSQSVQANPALSGYLVDKDGYVHVPLVGQVLVRGLTSSEARKKIAEEASKYYNNPEVNVRIINYEVAIYGEVAHPGIFTFPSEKVNVMEALATAGDITVYGRRKNVLLTREENGQRIFTRLNLNSSDLFKSPYYYLKQRDQLYVEPTKSKVVLSDNLFLRDLSIVTSLISVASLLLILRNNSAK